HVTGFVFANGGRPLNGAAQRTFDSPRESAPSRAPVFHWSRRVKVTVLTRRKNETLRRAVFEFFRLPFRAFFVRLAAFKFFGPVTKLNEDDQGVSIQRNDSGSSVSLR